MKLKSFLLTAAAMLAIAACDRDDSVKEKIDDGLDRRPAEGVRDAGEDIKDAVEDATR